ncbi:hypothetical protein ACFOSD_10305 [Salinispirillum marinum]|uniref:Uncharacterized protein n=2 Tax=Saccharospirillaceae TaxID=255527 RepID=A0ABV8BEH6_9GAMM
MNTTKLIKALVVFDVVLIVIAITLSYSLESYLPLLLQQYLIEYANSEYTTLDHFFDWARPLYLALFIAAVVGLLLTKQWGKYLYAVSFVLGLLLSPFAGPVVEHGVPDMLFDLSSAIYGAALALLFFSNSDFSDSNVKVPEAVVLGRSSQRD